MDWLPGNQSSRPSLENPDDQLVHAFRKQLESVNVEDPSSSSSSWPNLNQKTYENFLRDPRLGSDEYLRRFIVARQGNLDKSQEMIINHFDWRKKKQCAQVYERHMRGDLVPKETLDMVKHYYPHGYCGVDNDGCPVYYERFGFFDVKKITELCPEEKFVEYFMAEVENTQINRYAACKQYAKTVMGLRPEEVAQITRGTTVLDVSGMGLGFLSKTTRSIIQSICSMMADNYPDSAKAVYIVNCSKVATIVWSAIKVFVNADTVKKVKLVNKQKTLSTLEQVIPREHIPTFLGGDVDVGEYLIKDHGPWTEEGKRKYNLQDSRSPNESSTRTDSPLVIGNSYSPCDTPVPDEYGDEFHLDIKDPTGSRRDSNASSAGGFGHGDILRESSGRISWGSRNGNENRKPSDSRRVSGASGTKGGDSRRVSGASGTKGGDSRRVSGVSSISATKAIKIKIVGGNASGDDTDCQDERKHSWHSLPGKEMFAGFHGKQQLQKNSQYVMQNDEGESPFQGRNASPTLMHRFFCCCRRNTQRKQKPIGF